MGSVAARVALYQTAGTNSTSSRLLVSVKDGMELRKLLQVVALLLVVLFN